MRCVLCLLLLLFAAQALTADDPPLTLRLELVYRLKPVAGKQHFITRDDFEFEKRRAEIESPSFLAVATNIWPAGLVAIFAVEKTNRIELRRRPARGVENSSEPLFYALPPEDEPEAAKIAGRWECLGVRETGTKEFFGWDLSIEGENIAGRFDQFTDFRFARIVDGTFRSNQFELRIEYIMDAYVVNGTWHDGKLKGDWTNRKTARGKPLGPGSSCPRRPTLSRSTNGGVPTTPGGICSRASDWAQSGSAALDLSALFGTPLRSGHHAQHIVGGVLLQLVGVCGHRLKISPEDLQRVFFAIDFAARANPHFA